MKATAGRVTPLILLLVAAAVSAAPTVLAADPEEPEALSASAGGPYSAEPRVDTQVAASIAGGTPPYSCRWQASGISFLDAAACSTAARAPSPLRTELRLTVTDADGAQTTAVAQLIAETQAQDGDGDGIADSADNCPSLSNPSQSDRDHDGLGDDCDATPGDSSSTSAPPPTTPASPPDPKDADNDGVPDAYDMCTTVPDPDQEDLDGDTIGDACDLDRDADGIMDIHDDCPTVPDPRQDCGKAAPATREPLPAARSAPVMDSETVGPDLQGIAIAASAFIVAGLAALVVGHRLIGRR